MEAVAREEAQKRRLRVIDATCPLVTKVHIEVIRYARENYSIILIGHRNHDEVIGTLGEAPLVTQVVGSPAEVSSLNVPDPNRVAYLTQTTLSLDETRDIIAALKEKGVTVTSPQVSKTLKQAGFKRKGRRRKAAPANGAGDVSKAERRRTEAHQIQDQSSGPTDRRRPRGKARPHG